jgi:hypothetical protein
MRACFETFYDWRSRLARLETEIALTEATGEINWHLRIRARVLHYLLARYGEPVWETHWWTDAEDLAPAIEHRPDGPVDWVENDAAAMVRAAAGAGAAGDGLPELTWDEVCYCLLPWEMPIRPPGSEVFENRPRSREVLAERLRHIHAMNTAPRRRWFGRGW